MEASLAGKWLGLLKEIAPRVARVAFLFNPATAPFAEYYTDPNTEYNEWVKRAIDVPIRR
jgi:hypothetical protein